MKKWAKKIITNVRIWSAATNWWEILYIGILIGTIATIVLALVIDLSDIYRIRHQIDRLEWIVTLKAYGRAVFESKSGMWTTLGVLAAIATFSSTEIKKLSNRFELIKHLKTSIKNEIIGNFNELFGFDKYIFLKNLSYQQLLQNQNLIKDDVAYQHITVFNIIFEKYNNAMSIGDIEARIWVLEVAISFIRDTLSLSQEEKNRITANMSCLRTFLNEHRGDGHYPQNEIDLIFETIYSPHREKLIKFVNKLSYNVI